MKLPKHSESSAHTIALLIAVIGPLLNLVLGLSHTSPPPGSYLYWVICLTIYIIILIPFTITRPLTLIRLIILGIIVEDFSSHIWRSLFLNYEFLPFCNWYTQHFPFLGNLGEPTSLILIPQWYIIGLSVYVALTLIQFKYHVKKPDFPI